MRYENITLTNRTILLDGDQFVRCVFEKCVIQYAGGVLPVLQNVKFHACSWNFVGAAELTIKFLRILYASGGKDDVAAQIIKIIQQPVNKPENLPGSPMGFGNRN